MLQAFFHAPEIQYQPGTGVQGLQVLDVTGRELSEMVRPVNQLVLERLTVDIGVAAQIAEIGRTFKMQGWKQGHGCFFQGHECPVVSGWPEI